MGSQAWLYLGTTPLPCKRNGKYGGPTATEYQDLQLNTDNKINIIRGLVETLELCHHLWVRGEVFESLVDFHR